MKFRINSQPFSADRVSKPVHRAMQLLAQLQNGELLDVRGLSHRLGLSPETVKNWCVMIPADYRVFTGHRVYYANPKTIKAFKAELQSQRKTTR